MFLSRARRKLRGNGWKTVTMPERIETSFAAVLVLVLLTMACAQDNTPPQAAAPEIPKAATNAAAAATIGPPVTCTAHGYWSSTTGDARIILKKLDGSSGTVDVDVYDANNMRWRSSSLTMWTFKGGVLEYINPNRAQYRLVVGDTTLRGSYTHYGIPQLSKPEMVFNCDGPTERVIVR
jgi:hypothetical protein